MKRLALFLVLLTAPAMAKPVILGTLTSSGASVNNSSTAVAFTIDGGARMQLALQCDAAVYWRSGTGSSLTASSATGILLPASALPYPLGNPDSTVDTVAIVPVSGSATCKLIWLQQVARWMRERGRAVVAALARAPGVAWERRYLVQVRRA